MTFTQRRDYDAFELSYTLKYDLVKSKKAICGTLTVDAGEKWNKLVASPNYKFVNDIEGNLKLDTKRNSRYTFDVQIQYPNKKEAGKILLDIADVGEHNYETLHIKIPEIYLLELYNRLLQDELSVQAHEQLSEIIDRNECKFDIIDVVDSIPLGLTRSEYFQVLTRIVEYESSNSHYIKEIIIESFTDWVLGKSTGKYYTVDDINELQQLAQQYNSIEELPDVEQPILDQIILNREEYLEREFNGFLIENFDVRNFSYYDLSPRSFVFAVGILANKFNTEELISYISPHFKSDKSAGNIDDCFDSEIEDQIECLRSKLPAFAVKSDIESVRYGIARMIRYFLITKGNTLSPSNEAYLYRSIINICSDTSAVWLAEHARHYRHMRLAEDARESDPKRAMRHYDKAIVLLSQSDSWNPPADQHLWSVFRKTIHEAEMLEKEGLYGEAASKLAEREELIQEIGKEASDSLTHRIINQIEGHQIEYKGHEYLEQDQYERASELYNKAAGRYREADHEKLFNGIKGRQYQIDALLAEIGGEFEDAAVYHQQFVETLPNSAGAKFHQIRYNVCLAKSAAVEQEYEKAITKLEEIESELNATLAPTQQQFKSLLQAAEQFHKGEEVKIEQHMQPLITALGEEEERLLNFSDDYTTGHLTVLAAHRLLSLPIKKEDLEDIIEIAIKDACFPEAPEEQIKKLTESYASPTVGESLQWELSLPIHIIHQLDQFRIEKQTTFDEYASLVRTLAIITEQLLKILWEYYAKQHYGDNWRSKVPGSGSATLGDLYDFFNTELGSSLNSADDVINLFETNIVGEKLIKELRNALTHGRNPNITNQSYRQINEDQFEQIYDAVINVFKTITTDLPVLGIVDAQLSINTYKISLQWGGLPKRIWITTEFDLETDELYFFPREELDKDYEKTVSINANKIESCESDTRTHLIDN